MYTVRSNDLIRYFIYSDTFRNYLRPDGSIAKFWESEFFKDAKEAQSFLDKYDVNTGKRKLNIELGKYYLTKGGSKLKCIYIGEDVRNGMYIFLDCGGETLSYNKDLRYTKVVDHPMYRIVEEYKEKKVKYIGMCADGFVLQFYDTKELQDYGKTTKLIATKRIEEGEFDVL